MRAFKKYLSLLMICIIGLSVLPVSGVGAASAAALYGFYGDGMLFQQKVPAVFAGTAASGSTITAALKNAAGNTVAESSATAENGVFRVSLPAQEGSFSAYTVTLQANGAAFAELKDVVFGEFWIAAGQSNMGYPYAQAKNYVSPSKNATERKRWVRLLLTPDVPVENGVNGRIPALPQADLPGAKWVTANDDAAGSCSAVGYWFATDLIEALGMPVGLASIPLGGSAILSWLSREAIEGSPAVLAETKADGKYIALREWNEESVNVFYDMTTLYNLKVAPLGVLHPAGVIWYQGEDEAIFDWSYGRYARAFDLLQDTFTAAFGHSGPIPFVYSQLASYYYSSNERVINSNLEFADMQLARSGARAMVTGYDVPTEFYNNLGAIHPCDKEHLGRRMSRAAQGLVYGRPGSYTAAYLQSSRIADGGVYVTLQNAGDGLLCDGDALKGFSVAGENGVFADAEARIVSKDTVFISNPAVPRPAAAGYALAISNDRANLFASENGEKAMPAAPFITDRSLGGTYWQNNAWMRCDASTAWHNLADQESSTYFDTWSAENAALTFSADGMRATGSRVITLSPVLSYRDGIKTVPFSDDTTDWSGFGTLTLKIRNLGNTPLTLAGLWLTNSPASVFRAAANETGNTDVILPAGGEWTEVTFDLNALYLAGGRVGAVFSSASLTEVRNLRLVFSAPGKADFELGGFSFGPNTEKPKPVRFGIQFSFIARLVAFFRNLFSRWFSQ